MDLDQVVKEAFDRFQPIQCPDELRAAAAEVEKLKPKRVLELGTYRGGTLYVWIKCATDDAIVIGTDFGTPPETVEMIKLWASGGQSTELVLGDLQSPEFKNLILSKIGGPIDFLFIDDDHHYDIVKKNFDFWLPYVRSGGLIGFHDIDNDVPPTSECKRFWDTDIVPNFKNIKAIQIPATTGDRLGIKYGIGLVWKP